MDFWQKPNRIKEGDYVVILRQDFISLEPVRVIVKVVGFKDLTIKHKQLILADAYDNQKRWLKSPESCLPLTSIEIAKLRADLEG